MYQLKLVAGAPFYALSAIYSVVVAALKGLKLIEVWDPVVMLRQLQMFLSRLGWAPPDNVLSVVLLLTGRLLTARNEGDRCLRYFGCWSLLEA